MPVQQHPVPQNIASYEFRLVGDMTLRQFGYLAAGTLVALILYGTPLPGFIKWPLILFSGFFGFAFAFMPIGERPLSTWLLAFIKTVVSPTLFVWQKKAKKPEIFEPVIRQSALLKTPVLPPDKEQLSQYLKTLPVGEPKSPLDKREEEFLKQIASLFPTTHPIREIPKIEEVKPLPKPLPRPLPKPPIEEFIFPKEPKKPTVEAKFGLHLPIPEPPTRPNIITGMVLDKNGELLEGAILEIRNSQGMPVRALKTNKLGQFTIATPLENDTYEIEIEKEGFEFDIIKFEAKGEIIQPLEIKAK